MARGNDQKAGAHYRALFVTLVARENGNLYYRYRTPLFYFVIPSISGDLISGDKITQFWVVSPLGEILRSEPDWRRTDATSGRPRRRDTPARLRIRFEIRLGYVAIVALFRGVDDALVHPRETRLLPARLRSPS